ncbi:MAG: hypothetical protein K1X66_04535 [Verrucomicrobiae bacterium]|nr:hypothetical protein [Verrucomicrobiae bacterium]
MKIKWFLLGLTLLMLNQVQGQLVTDHFPYAAGDVSLAVGSGWTVHSGATPVNVIDTPSDSGNSLSFPGLAASSGNRIVVSQSQTADIGTNFTAQVTQDNTSVYASFLVKFTTLPSAAGEYFSYFFDGNMGIAFRSRVYAKNNGGNVQLGIRFTSGGNPVYAANSFALNTTHFVVIKYTRVAGVDNDTAALFLDPNPGMAEPAPSAMEVNPTAGHDVANIARFALRQNSNIGILEFDELRIGATWADVTGGGMPPPPDATNIVSVVATDGSASELGANPGTFTLSRSGSTNAITVLYAMSGTATNGDDYTTLPGSIQLGENVMSADIVLNPIVDGIDETAETATLTLSPDNAYQIDPNNANATITITEENTGLIEPFIFLKIKPLAGTVKFVNPKRGFKIKGRFYNQWINNNLKAVIQYALEWGTGSNKVNTGFMNMPTKQKTKGPNQGKGRFHQGKVGVGLNIPPGPVNILLRARQGSQNFSAITTNTFEYQLKVN